MKSRAIITRAIEAHNDGQCDLSRETITEIAELICDDYSSETVESAFEEVLGDLDEWDGSLFDEIATALLEEHVGSMA